jgi:uncharacterized repeat protein (TIGR01451 family)
LDLFSTRTAQALLDCTITDNRSGTGSGAGVGVRPGSVPPNLRHTVVAANGPNGDIAGPVNSLGYNFIANGLGAAIFGNPTGNQVGPPGAPLDPRLGPLQDNGGATPTRLPLAGSPLINAGDPAFAPPPDTDQRGPGFPRVRGGRIDIGATEGTVRDLSVTLTDGRRIVTPGGTTTYTAVVQDTGDVTATGAVFAFPVPAGVSAMTWTAAATGGATGFTPAGSGPIADSLTLPPGASVTYTVTAMISPAATGTVTATAALTPPPGFPDDDPANNTATDVDAVLVGGRLIAAGPGSASLPEVALFAGDGTPLYTLTAYDPTFGGGVRVAVADFTADGIPDVVTAAGPGGGPHVRLFNGATGAPLREFFAYGAAFTGGVYVAAGDVTGDGTPDIITAAGEGGGPHVKVYDGSTGAVVREFGAYDPAFRGGVRVAVGDTDGDGFADVVTGPGSGGGPHVRIFSGATGAVLGEALVYDAAFRGGVYVAAGDVDGDGRAEVITGPGEGGGPIVRVFRAPAFTDLRTFAADADTLRNGVRVAAVDATGDGLADVVTGAGPGPAPGGAPTVRVFDGATGSEVRSFLAFDPAYTGGVFVGAG